MTTTNFDLSHSGDIAMDRFAVAMKGKLAAGRTEGRGGWDDPALRQVERPQAMLADHVLKGNPVDVGNVAMMLWHRGVVFHAPECVWRLDDGDSGTWASACGELGSFVDGGPKENRVSYCHHCGREVTVRYEQA